MKLPALLLCGASLVGTAGGALAGEDSTHRLHGVGPAWYEIDDGLRKLAAEPAGEPAPTDPAANGSFDESRAAKRPSCGDSADKDARVTDPAHAKSTVSVELRPHGWKCG